MGALLDERTMAIPVTQDHLKRGKPRDNFLCPIALAIEEDFPESVVELGYGKLSIDKPMQGQDGYLFAGEYNASIELCRWINDYDKFGAAPQFPVTIVLNLDENNQPDYIHLEGVS